MDKCLFPQCDQLKISNHHCQLHNLQFKPKYLRYKKLQENLPRLDNLDILNLIQLLKLYNQFAQVFKLRRLCMRKYFDVKYWDIGHNLMSANIFSDLVKIEKWISKNIIVES